MIIKTGAIVLNTIDYSESSVIARLFTKNHGVVSVIAKGARKPKSKFSSFLVPGQVLEVVFYHKPTRSVQTLSDASFLVKLDQLRVNIEKMAITVTTMELVAQVLHENETNESLFIFLKKLLYWLNGRESVSRKFFPYIQTRIIDYIGIGLQKDDMPETIHDSPGYINIESGFVSHRAESGQAVPLSGKQLMFLNEILQSNKPAVFKKKLSKNELTELIEYLDRYIRYHVEGVKPRRSDKIFDQILNH